MNDIKSSSQYSLIKKRGNERVKLRKKFKEEEGILMSVTEKRTKDELDQLVQLLEAM